MIERIVGALRLLELDFRGTQLKEGRGSESARLKAVGKDPIMVACVAAVN
jgi:hypothetical protein